MQTEQNSKKSLYAIFLALVSIGAWTCYVLLMRNEPAIFANETPRALARVLLVLLPALTYALCQKEQSFLDYLSLRENWSRGLALGLAIAVAYLYFAVLKGMHKPSIVFSTDSAVWLNFIIGSPVAEEVLFRGVLFKELASNMKWGWAMFLSSVLFTVLHFPVWILIEQMPVGILAQNAVSIFMYGVVFAALMKATKSLWAPLAAHCTNNFILLSVTDNV